MDNVLTLLKDRNIIIPSIFLEKYRSMELDDKEFILLCYLMNNNTSFNPKQIGNCIGYSFKEVLELINNLVEKGFLDIKVSTTNNIKEEYIDLDKLYNKLAFLVINNDKVNEEPSNLFSIFEKEFGRTLSPIEYELINAWKENKFSEELILEALKEAVLNGVSNLRYIDKILYEWNRKGIKNKKDIESNKKEFKQKKVEVFDYDWLNED